MVAAYGLAPTPTDSTLGRALLPGGPGWVVPWDAMTAPNNGPFGVLLDIDGVLYVGDQPIEGAHQAFSELRELSAGVRLMTNTTSRSRRAVREHLLGMRFDVSLEEVLTPAGMAERYCRERGYGSVSVFVSEGLREDLATLASASRGARIEAVVLGDLG